MDCVADRLGRRIYGAGGKSPGLRSPAIILRTPAFYAKKRRDVKIYGRAEEVRRWGGGASPCWASRTLPFRAAFALSLLPSRFGSSRS